METLSTILARPNKLDASEHRVLGVCLWKLLPIETNASISCQQLVTSVLIGTHDVGPNTFSKYVSNMNRHNSEAVV